ncbi:MAG: J domain-containing protein [Desulfobacterales bacterium]|nr:J domain-containing protein [Desulfobacterales bacterium]
MSFPGKHSRRQRDDQATSIREYIRLAARANDTPRLIREIAENRRYLLYCAIMTSAEPSEDAEHGEIEKALAREAARQNCAYEKLQHKLGPVAVALGLSSGKKEGFQADYYNVLGISSGSSRDEIKKAYWHKARQTHPDTHEGEPENFINVRNAYEVLSDESLRRQYDISRKQSAGWSWSEDAARSQPEKGPAARIFNRQAVYFAGLILFLILLSILIDRGFQESSLKGGGQFFTEETAVPARKGAEQEAAEPARTEAAGREKAGVEPPERPSLDDPRPSPSDQQKPKEPRQNANVAFAAAMAEHSAQPDLKVFNRRYDKPQTVFPAVKASAADDEENAEKPVNEEPVKKSHEEMAALGASDREDAKAPPPPNPFTPFDSANMRKQLNAFLRDYCEAYESMNLDAFKRFFTDNAIENKEPFKKMIPQYRRNFNVLDAVDYRIRLKHFTCHLDERKVIMDGRFSLKWRKPENQNWHEYEGRITMSLVPQQTSYLIRKLSYRFDEE